VTRMRRAPILVIALLQIVPILLLSLELLLSITRVLLLIPVAVFMGLASRNVPSVGKIAGSLAAGVRYQCVCICDEAAVVNGDPQKGVMRPIPAG
jgi:hypothetical protein